VRMRLDEKMNNAATFECMREDHTLGHLVRMECLRDPDVRFCGYQIEHPLKHDVMIKVQTTKRSTPATAVEHACERLAGEYRAMARSFQFALERAGEAGGMEER